jgi:O-antigen/teichoic acid export membrane protein
VDKDKARVARLLTRLIRPGRRRARAAVSLSLAERVAVNFSAQLGAQLILAVGGLISVAVTTRYLDLRHYGALVTALIFVSLFTIMTDFGITTIGGRELAKASYDRRRILSSIGLVVAAISLLALGAAIGLAQIAYAGPGGVDVRLAVLILAPQLLIVGPRSAAQADLISRQRVYLSSVAAVATRVLTLGLVIAVAEADLGFLAMTAAYAAFPILGGIVTIALARTGLPRIREWDRSLAVMLVKASVPLAGVIVLNYLYFRLDLFLLSILATKTDVALYGVAYKVIEMLILVPSYIMITLFPTLAAAPPFSEQLRNLVQSAFTVMQFIAVPLIAVSFFSGQILQFIAGKPYEDASLALQLLMCGMALSFLQQVIGYTLVALNRQTWALFALAAVLILNLILNLILIPLFAINGAAIALVASEVASLALILIAYSRIGQVPTLYQPAKVLAAGATMLGLILATRETLGSTLSPLVTLTAGGILSFGAYVIVLRQLGAVPPAATAALSNLIGRMRHA